jgi:hypothetical protein
MMENEAQCRVTFSENFFKSCIMPKRQTSNFYELAMSHGFITNTPMIRLGLH